MARPWNASGWRPSAELALLEARADLFALIRDFFATRAVMEVDTPLLGMHTATEPHLDSIVVPFPGKQRFLQTSPEFAMKRLLAAYPVAMYQLGKAFRNAEQGRRHNPEFTMLEWYRPGYSLLALIDEVAQLGTRVLGLDTVRRRSYREAFQSAVGFDPHQAEIADLAKAARRMLDVDFAGEGRDFWLDLLFSHLVEPGLGQNCLEFIVGFPPSQAALSQIDLDDQGMPVAQRFELFVSGVELANGYLELRDADELRGRMEGDLERRAASGRRELCLDERLLAAMAYGLPDCAGVALGVDRLLMLKQGSKNLADVIPFSFDIA